MAYKHDDEPEWMEFGPNDRSEVIELKGLEEHERGREEEVGREGGKQRVDEEVGKQERGRSGEDEVRIEGRKLSFGEDESGGGEDHSKAGACDENKDSVEKEGGEEKQGETRETAIIVVNSMLFFNLIVNTLDVTKYEDLKVKEGETTQPVGSEGTSDHVKVQSQTQPLQSSTPLRPEDNFIVDGFDFSTGVSICLAMDEDLEDSGDKGKDGVDETAQLFRMMQTTTDSSQGELP